MLAPHVGGRWPLATCCKPARQGKHAAGMPWVIWVIWVIILNRKPAALGWHALGHLGHCFYVDPIDLKGADLAPRLWVIWVILSSNKNWRPERRARSMHGLLGINPYIKIINFVFCIS
jgi:hypothetical protein